jgi:ferritin-like metal-binding protein YciE
MPEKNLRELFHDTLKDIYFCREENHDGVAQDGEGRSSG